MGPSIVERWLELSTQELRPQVKQLVSARLPDDHAVWQAVRRHPALVARIRGVLSGLAAEAAGSKDEHMQKVWISAARTALDQQNPPKASPKRAAPKQVIEEPEAPAELQLPEPPKPKAAPAIPAMVFQEPS